MLNNLLFLPVWIILVQKETDNFIYRLIYASLEIEHASWEINPFALLHGYVENSNAIVSVSKQECLFLYTNCFQFMVDFVSSSFGISRVVAKADQSPPFAPCT